MSVITKNKEAYAKRYGEYHITSIADNIVSEPAKKEEAYTVKIMKDNHYYYLHSRYKPIFEAERIADELYTMGNMHIIIGNGLGYLAKSLLSKFDKEDFLLIIEPSVELFHKSMETVDLTDLLNNDQVIIHIGDILIDLEKKLYSMIGSRYLTLFKMYISANYDKIFPNKVLDISKTVKEAVWLNRVVLNTLFLFSEEWHENYLLNMKHAIKSIPFNSFRKQFSLPVIIVAAGPSLEEELDLLKSVRNRALIIAAGSAVTTLKHYGIKPHIVVSLDGGEANYKHFKNIDYEDIPLFYTPMINRKILDEYKGPKVIFQMENNKFIDWYNQMIKFDPGETAKGPSVANTTLDIACKISDGPICLIGQDLGYIDGYSHAPGNKHRKLIKPSVDNKQKVELEANDGSIINSHFSFLSMKKWFEHYLNTSKNQNIYNATKRGARIEGTKIIDFQEFIDKFCLTEMDIDYIINRIISKSKHTVNKERFYSDIESNKKVIQEIIENTSEGKKIAEELLNRIKDNPLDKSITGFIEQLDLLDEKMKLEEMKDTFMFFIIRPLLVKLDTWDYEKSYENDIEEMLDIGKKNYYLYDKLNQIAKRLKEIFDNI